MREAPFLLARLHLPLDHRLPFIFSGCGDKVGPMDGSVFTFPRGGDLVNAYAWWHTSESEVIGRGATGVIRLMPMVPDLWAHLKAGQTIELLHAILAAQLIQPLTETST
ncbi:hypothetical protein GO986_01145 [Deinococcus sp. HMF7620]|uniref:Uncharacterized protein n=1 Tax=Deinococcus arboris TaxID=2682977 RepID=A0A7C9HPC4_9DEIO|nr:hypothetical protein [Deinococcus arboris]MVN85372.1 hypothetical protein [Deinococcus arboris]